MFKKDKMVVDKNSNLITLIMYKNNNVFITIWQHVYNAGIARKVYSGIFRYIHTIRDI